jgi:hypothetical protein
MEPKPECVDRGGIQVFLKYYMNTSVSKNSKVPNTLRCLYLVINTSMVLQTKVSFKTSYFAFS